MNRYLLGRDRNGRSARPLAWVLAVGLAISVGIGGAPSVASPGDQGGTGDQGAPALMAEYSGPVIVDNSQVRYTGSDQLTFVLADWLEQHHPRLMPLRPAIDTWAARHAVHPRVLSAVVRNAFTGKALLGDRSDRDRVAEIATALATVLESQRQHFLAASRAVTAVARAYDFGLSLSPDLAQPRSVPLIQGGAPPLFGYFQPPWEVGDTWSGGGVHGGAQRNALDFFGEFRDWGEDVSSWWVAAMQEGTARVWSSCGVSVIHPNGWTSFYYHLENVQLTDFATVQRNARVSNYADDLDQALCQGGASTAPHVHVSVTYMGQPVEIDEDTLDFTSFSHHAGVGNYDNDCTRSWYNHGTAGQVCPWEDALLNDVTVSGILFADGFESSNTSAWDVP